MKSVSSLNRAALSVAPGKAATKRAHKESVKPRDADHILSSIVDYFPKWDLDSNGSLSWSEMRKCVANPEIRGEEAVTLASLRGLLEHDSDFRGKSKPAPVSVDQIYDKSFEYDTEAENDEDVKPVLEALYEKFAQKVGVGSEELFPDQMPNSEFIKQGTAPSCGFLSVTYAQTLKDPNSVHEAISPRPDGMIDVHFPGIKHTISVNSLTPTERLLASSAGDNGTWLPTLEKAWGKHLAKGREEAAFEMTTYPENAIEAWTSHEASTSDIPAKGRLAESLKPVEQSLAAGGTVVAWTKNSGVKDGDFVTGHAYTVTGIDNEAHTISLRNPWGHLEPLNAQGKPKDGKDDGKFSISFEEFRKNFKSLAQEEAGEQAV